MSKTSIKIQWENQCEDLYSYQIVYFLNQTDNPSILMTLNLTGENSVSSKMLLTKNHAIKMILFKT